MKFFGIKYLIALYYCGAIEVLIATYPEILCGILLGALEAWLLAYRNSGCWDSLD